MSTLGDMKTALNPEKKCKAATVLEALSPEERALADLRNPDGTWVFPRRQLAAILRANGLYVGPTLLGDHRAGRCPCQS